MNKYLLSMLKNFMYKLYSEVYCLVRVVDYVQFAIVLRLCILQLYILYSYCGHCCNNTDSSNICHCTTMAIPIFVFCSGMFIIIDIYVLESDVNL